MDREAGQAIVHEVAKSWIQLKQFNMHAKHLKRFLLTASFNPGLWLYILDSSYV